MSCCLCSTSQRDVSLLRPLHTCGPGLEDCVHHSDGGSADAAAGTTALWETQSHTEITDTHVYRSKVVWSSRKDVLTFNHLSLLWPLFLLAIRCQTSLFNLFILAVAVRLSHTQNRLKTTEVLMHGLFLKSQMTVFSEHVVVLCFLLDSTDAADNLSSSDTNNMREYMNRRGVKEAL